MTLNMLKPGRTAIIKEVESATAADRRRLLDLGILPGAEIENVMSSPLGDPVAYRVKNTVIALRNEQTVLIEVEENETEK